MAAWTCRQFAGKAAPKIVPLRSRTPCWKGLGADSEEKREPVSDFNAGVVDSLKALDPNGRLEKLPFLNGLETGSSSPICAVHPCGNLPNRRLARSLEGMLERREVVQAVPRIEDGKGDHREAL